LSYKTILVHLNDKRRAETVLEPAVQLATRYNFHLVALHVAAEHRDSDDIVATFSRMTTMGAFVAERQLLEAYNDNLASVVLERGRGADLIIAGQTDPDWDLAPLRNFPERLALESGRPVLVIPYVERYPRIGCNVVVAWKAGRESARAVFDALPILKEAENVHILEVKERPNRGTSLAPDSSIAPSLARHGIKPTIRTSIASDISVGDQILARLADLDADLLVMGAYGHSRMRELVFGGATRLIARYMTVPTLFSH
jgi:nucleotide-binding universal stress UspA family protein